MIGKFAPVLLALFIGEWDLMVALYLAFGPYSSVPGVYISIFFRFWGVVDVV